MAFLKAVNEHGSVLLPPDVGADFNHALWCHAHDLAVESSMMKLAQREAVEHFGHASLVTIGDDVRCFQQLAPTQGADRSRFSVGL